MTRKPSGDCGQHDRRGGPSRPAIRQEVYADMVGAESQIDHAENMLAAMPAQTRIDVTMISDAFAAAGHELYAVGGTVRDYLMGRPVAENRDLDFATDAEPEVTRRLLSDVADNVWNQGEKFGTIAAIVNGSPYEITTLRNERYESDSRKPHVEFTGDIHSDLSRRDFTVNAIGVQFPDGALLDPHDGMKDLDAKCLRTPLKPSDTFSDDPLRMIRAARFMSQLDMALEETTRQAVFDMCERIDMVAVERIMPEIDKLLGAADPSKGLALLWESGILERVLGGHMGDREEIIARVVRADDVDTRTVMLFSGCEEDLEVRLRDCKWPLDRLRFVNRVLKAARIAVHNTPTTDREMRQWEDENRDVAEVSADVAALLGSESIRKYRQDLVEIGELRCDLPLDGKDIMDFVGIPPGQRVGYYKQMLQEYVWEKGNITKSDAYALLRKNSPELQQRESQWPDP